MEQNLQTYSLFYDEFSVGGCMLKLVVILLITISAIIIVKAILPGAAIPEPVSMLLAGAGLVAITRMKLD